LLETDCPYLTPPQIEGRNEPIYLKYIAQKIAEIKNISFEKVAEITTQNARKLFNI
jgi:TatD DNase family protein